MSDELAKTIVTAAAAIITTLLGFIFKRQGDAAREVKEVKHMVNSAADALQARVEAGARELADLKGVLVQYQTRDVVGREVAPAVALIDPLTALGDRLEGAIERLVSARAGPEARA